ncbi:sigma-54 dependent transcriptional regulator [Tissierella carlieri]|uniref:sigma-54-dependent transcriptional regulator n=1 Tax=Tissierella carlieri TaxID=689904 RepID=UPI001C11C999|nr:sigma-54 dependent transcriptional regulator [Tissierella carlieri]MBU5313111.1 sigma-54 dependent transcriptional regulator [Tissierella carlieri]
MKEVFKILIVDDEKEHRETYRMLLESRGFIIGEASSGDEALNILESEYYPIVLCDVVMPGLSGIEVLKKIKSNYESVEVIMVTGYGGVETAVEAMKIGAFGYFIKSHNPEELLIEIEKTKKLLNLQKKNNMISTKKNKERYLYQSKNPKMKELLNTLEDIGQSSANVLLLGESGVGKEIIAQRLHDISKRSNMPFIAINCQYYSTNLLESELFGHEKGSFTGANEKRIGRFEEANGGTIFLDEIGEISQEIQVKFLRVLENRKIERMGSNKQIEVDFRLICATNKNLLHEIQSGNFREDLFYRINTIILEIPPLRERKEDILDMINFFIDNYKMEFKKDITKIENETLEYLLNYSYPGNIRELKNIIERMFVLCKDGVLKMEGMESSTAKNFDSHKHFDILDFNLARANFEKEYLINVLKLNDNNITKTAEVIGLSRRQLFNKINEYNLREFMS